MKRQLMALSLGLSLVGCQNSVPLSGPAAPGAPASKSTPKTSSLVPLTAALHTQKNANGYHQLKLQVSFDGHFQTQALNCNTNTAIGPATEITKLKITVSGPGMSAQSPLGADDDGNVEADNCSALSTVSFNDIPEGALRLLRIQGVRADNSGVPGADVWAAFSLQNEQSQELSVNARSTPAAIALDKLLNHATVAVQRGTQLASKVNLTKIQDFVDALTGWNGESHDSAHPSFVNTTAITNWLIDQPENQSADALNDALQALIDDPQSHGPYLLGTGSVSGTIIGARAGQDILVRYNDPGSPTQSIISSDITSSEVNFEISPTLNSGSYLLEAMQGAEPYRHGTLNSVAPGSGYLLSLAEPLSNTWSVTGQPTGGKITALVRYNASKIYAGLENGGVYKYEGGNWSRIPGLLHGQQVKALTVNPDANKVYVATNTGIYASISDGDWSQVYNSSSHSGIVINDLLVDPQDTADVYAATSLGLLRSDNGGDFVLVGTAPTVNLLRVVKYNPVTAANARFFAMGAPGDNRIYRSQDGLSWETFYEEFTHNLIDIAVNSETGVLAVASTDSGTPHIRYEANLLTGAPISTLLPYGATGFGTAFSNAAPSRLHFKDDNINELYVATKNQSIKFVGGLTGNWENLDPPPAINQPHVTALIDAMPNLIAGTMGGGVSELSSSSTDVINNGLSGQYITALARHPGNASVLAAGTSGGGVFISNDGGESWSAHHEGLFNDPRERQVSSLAFDSNGHLYAGTAGGGIHVIFDPGTCLGSSNWNWQNLSFGPTNAKVQALAAVDGKVFAGLASDGMLTDQGLYSSNLPVFDGTTCLSTVQAPDTWTPTSLSTQNIHSLAVKPGGSTGNWTLLAGSSGGQIYRSSDSGSNWSAAISTGLSQPVLHIGVSPDIPEYIYAIAHQTQGVVASTDSGANWTSAGQQLPTDGEARPKSLTVFRQNANRVLIGMENGQVYYSESPRISNSPWTALHPEDVRLPITALLALDDGSSHLVLAGTLGRSLLYLEAATPAVSD